MFALMVVIAVEFEERGCRLTFQELINCGSCSWAGGDKTLERSWGPGDFLVLVIRTGLAHPANGVAGPGRAGQGLPVEKTTAIHHQSRIQSRHSPEIASNADWPSRSEDMPCNDLFHLRISQ